MSKNNRNNKYKTSGHSVFQRVMIAVVVLGIGFLLITKFVLPNFKTSAKKIAAEKTVDIITKQADKIAETNPKVAKVLENLTEEDKETVSEIIENHLDSESVNEVMEYVKDKDKEGLVEYAAENLTPQEITDLMELYMKYGDEGISLDSIPDDISIEDLEKALQSDKELP